MKELSIYIRKEDLPKVTEILRKNNVIGISFYEIMGAGKSKREEVPEMVRSYMTGRTITPAYVKRTKVETIVPDSAVDQIADDVLNNLNPGKEARGIIFVKDVSDAYEIGTKQRGEVILSSK
jgi:nitrogen regulatory protein P-II 1